MFIPLFQPPDDETPNTRQRALKMMVVGLLTAMGVGLFLAFTRGYVSGPTIYGVIAIMIILAVAALVMLVNGASSQRRAEKDKRKRDLDGLDMYTLIDRLIDDLDDDERAYLQKRLDERQTAKKDDLAQTVDYLLEQRAHNRQP